MRRRAERLLCPDTSCSVFAGLMFGDFRKQTGERLSEGFPIHNRISSRYTPTRVCRLFHVAARNREFGAGRLFSLPEQSADKLHEGNTRDKSSKTVDFIRSSWLQCRREPSKIVLLMRRWLFSGFLRKDSCLCGDENLRWNLTKAPSNPLTKGCTAELQDLQTSVLSVRYPEMYTR